MVVIDDDGDDDDDDDDFARFFIICWVFFKINFFQKFFQEYCQSVKQFGSISGPTF